MTESPRGPDPISPELCLVDPELAAWARLRPDDQPRYAAPKTPTPQRQSVWRSRAWSVALTALTFSLALNVLTLTGRRVALPNHDTARAGAKLSWHPVSGARGYDVILWRDGERVLDLWPTAAHVTVPSSWRHRGAVITPQSGTIQWFVYPILSRSPKPTFGTLAAYGQLGT